MKNHARHVVALATGALFISGAIALSDPNVEQASTPSNGQSGQVASPQGQGQQADQMLLQQLRQFSQDPKTAGDKLFLLNTAIGSGFEVELSQQAQQKAQSDQVKQLAQRLVQDHQKMNQKLVQTAQQLGVQAPSALPAIKQEEIQIFSSMSGRDFDQNYVACMEALHAHDVCEFDSISVLSQNPQVKQFAAEFLPSLREHRQMVRQAAEGFGIKSSGNEAIPASSRLHGSGGAENTPGGAGGGGTGGTGTGATGTGGTNGTGTGVGNSGPGATGTGNGGAGATGTGGTNGTAIGAGGTGTGATGTGNSGTGAGGTNNTGAGTGAGGAGGAGAGGAGAGGAGAGAGAGSTGTQSPANTGAGSGGNR